MGDRSEIGIVLLGLGVVGAGVARALLEKADNFSQRVGLPLALRRVLVRDIARGREVSLPDGLLTTDAGEALNADSDIVVEVMGGERPACEYIEQSVRAGRR